MAKVRIAVAVDADGEWNAVGEGNVLTGSTMSDYDLMRDSSEPLELGERYYFVEVDIEPPVIETINAEAIEVK